MKIFFNIMVRRLKLKCAFKNNCSTKTMCSIASLKDMPHPPSLPIIGTKIDFILAGSGTRIHEYIDRRHRQLGPIFYEKLGGNTELVFVSDPELMKTLFLNLEGKYPAHILPEPWILYEKLYGSQRGLFFMNGEEWLNNRRIMNKHLLREDSHKWLEGPINSTIKQFITKWKTKAAENNVIFELESLFYRLSIDVIVAVLLGKGASLRVSKQNEELLIMFSETVRDIFKTTTKLYNLPVNWCQRMNLKVWKDFKNSVDMSLLLAKKIINEIQSSQYEGDGLLCKLGKENIDNELIQRIIADFVIAAGDTTAYTTLWIVYMLCKNEDVLMDLRMRDPSYTKHVVKETMRLYPVAPFLTRILTRDCILGSYKLLKGTPVIASIYTSGRDEHNFSEPNKFLPYRWDRNDPKRKNLINHVPSASLPFALGTRSCIGKKIAMLQLTEITRQIVDNFDIKCLNKTEVKAITSQVLIPNRPIEISLSVRKDY